MKSMEEKAKPAKRFASLVERLLSVPREEMQRREAEYKRQSEANPHRRGPKRKVKPSAGDHEATDRT